MIAVGVVIGDVVGHDLTAAAAMSQTRSMRRALLYAPQATTSPAALPLEEFVHTPADQHPSDGHDGMAISPRPCHTASGIR